MKIEHILALLIIIETEYLKLRSVSFFPYTYQGERKKST